MLKALLVNNVLRGTEHYRTRTRLLKTWASIQGDLARLLRTLNQKREGSTARTHTAPYNSTVAADIAGQHLQRQAEPTLFDELLEHLRTIHDPQQEHTSATHITFFTKVHEWCRMLAHSHSFTHTLHANAHIMT